MRKGVRLERGWPASPDLALQQSSPSFAVADLTECTAKGGEPSFHEIAL